jgi:acetolactate synthase-1/2/3 large subunit
MNGADALCETLLAADIDVCFSNPVTSEMHFVAALDRQPRMRCVLGLFEGVVTGAADGYARMAEKPPHHQRLPVSIRDCHTPIKSTR